MSSSKIHSVTTVCPSAINGLSLDWMAEEPDARRAWIQIDVSTRYMRGTFASLQSLVQAVGTLASSAPRRLIFRAEAFFSAWARS
jgi:hypothetical protein